jgi:hypothetical protein
MLTAIALAGIFVVFLGLALSALAIYVTDGRGVAVHERLG